jgi:uncharacterized membrane protein
MASNSAQISSTSTLVSTAKTFANAAWVLPLLVAAHDAANVEAQAIEPDDPGTFELSPGFEVIGDGDPGALYVTAMSEAGEVVVGYRSAASGDQAVRWSIDDGLETLAGTGGRANSVSPDGTLVAGSIAASARPQGRAAVLWRTPEAFQLLEGQRAQGAPILWMSEARVVLDDGSVFGTCLQSAAYGEPLACRYDGGGVIETFGVGHVYAANADGLFAGTRHSERHAPFTTVATFNGQALAFPEDAGCGPIAGCLAAAYDFSGAGEVVVGAASVPAKVQGTSADGSVLEQVAFASYAGRALSPLADLEGGARASGAYAISQETGVIAGFGTSEAGQRAVVWLYGEPRALDQLAREADVALPANFRLLDVRAVSRDGRVFAGNGRDANGNARGYRLVLPTTL